MIGSQGLKGRLWTYRIAISHLLDLVIVLTFGQPSKAIWEQFATVRVQLFSVVHGELCPKGVDGDDERSTVSLKL